MLWVISSLSPACRNKWQIFVHWFFFFNLCPMLSYTRDITLHYWERVCFLSVLSRNKISVFKKCSFFHICCLYSWVPGSWKHSILVLQLEIETVFKVAFFLLNVKEKLYLFPKWGMEARLKKGLHYCFCKYHFVKSLQMEHSSVEALKTLRSQTCR